MACELKDESPLKVESRLLELQLSGQFVLALLQVLPLLDVSLLHVLDLRLHRLQFGKLLAGCGTGMD